MLVRRDGCDRGGDAKDQAWLSVEILKIVTSNRHNTFIARRTFANLIDICLQIGDSGSEYGKEKEI